MQDLRVSLVQSELHWENKAANLASFERKLAPLAGQTDIVVLPEMFSTGFTMNAEELAEEMEGPSVRWLKNMAASLQAVVTGSFIAKEGTQYFNRLVWMAPGGDYFYYDKRHLFTLAGEHNFYSAGNTRLLVECKGWKILPLICYDLRFPVWSRNTEGYDLLIYVANWPERRVHAWNSLLPARAIENQSYVAGVNRVGHDGNEIYHSGDSALIDYSGRQLFRLSHQEGVFTISLSYQEQQDFRQRLQFLADRDSFQVL